MAPRLQLHEILVGLTEHVYFQPGTNVKLHFPCIIYQRDSASAQHADNEAYRYTQRYQVTYIDRNPDSDAIQQLALLPLCSFSRHFVADDLNHDVFNIFF